METTWQAKDISKSLWISLLFLLSACHASNAEYDCYRGDEYFANGKYDLAIIEYTKLIKSYPGRFEAYHKRGDTWYHKQSYDQAIADYSKAIELNPKNVEAFFQRGDIWYTKEKYEDAILDYSQAIRLCQECAQFYFRRAEAWFEKGFFDMAINDFTKVIELAPKDYLSYKKRGDAHVKMGHWEKAIADYTSVINKTPKNAILIFNRGVLWSEIEKYENAITDFSKAIELNPKDDISYNRLAWILATTSNSLYRDGSRAVALAQKAVQIKKCPEYLDTLAAAYAESGDFANAVKTEQEAYELRPDDVFQALIQAYKQRQTYVEYAKGELIKGPLN